tara:strand:+ start:4842 stop:5756 length:915 start_codon:yes stop_codon:yes gene_type:complete
MVSLIKLLKEVIIKEGGNVFKNTEYDTQNIPLDNIQPTVNKFAEDLSKLFPAKSLAFKNITNKNSWLGSTGKKPESGDVDLAFPIEHFFLNGEPDIKGWRISEDEFNALYGKNRKRARTATDEQIQVKSMVELIVQKINSSGTDLFSSDKASGAGSIHFSFPQYTPSGEKLNSFSQFDLDIGDIDWLKFRFNSVLPKDNPQIKGLHRGQLMLAMFAVTGYTFKSGKGFIRKDNREIVAKKPQGAMEVFNSEYNPPNPLTLEILGDYGKLVNYIKDNFKPEDKNSTLDMFKRALERADAYVPDNI